MAYNSVIDNVYNHFLTAYAPKGTVSKYDAHKKSELRGVYNSMLKLNKDAPLYILDQSTQSREFAIDLKENARMLRNTIASLGGTEDNKLFNKRSAYSTDEDMVSASYIGELEEGAEPPSFTLEVTGLSKGQENLGYALTSNAPVSIPADAYSFDVSINDLNYEFQFNVREGDTNKDVQERLARLISNSEIGIKADVLSDGKGNSALRMVSEATGLKPGKDSIFVVSDENTSKAKGAVEYLGIDYISSKPSNASFILNGEERSAASNHFTIDRQFEITLNGLHKFDGDAAQIGLKTDLESVAENVGRLVDGYNSFIDAANAYKNTHPASNKLLSEMERLISYYEGGLNNLGMEIDDQKRLVMNDNALKASLAHDEDYSQLSTIKDFAGAVLRKANQISLNPMEYVDKTVVAYKNPGHNFNTPYISSNYSGMLFNSYC